MNKIINKFQNSRKVTLMLALALFVLVNWLNYGFYVRFDLSASGRYRLTGASKDILRNLPEKVTIEAYFSKDISEAYMQPVKQLRDFLEEYASSSHGRVHLLFLNPDEDEKIMQKARSLGIQPMPIGSVDRKKQEVSRVFLSLALYYEDKTQVIPDILRQSQALEYFLTANIYKMAHPTERNIGLLETGGEFATTSGDNPFHSLEILDKSMQTFYGNMISVKADAEEISDNISVLFIVSPHKLTEMEKYHIDQFIMRGGKVILASGGVDINFNNLVATPKEKDVLEFFSNYGIAIHPDMVYDSKNYIPFRQPVNMLQMIEIPYPVWLAIPSESLNQGSLLTKNFKYLVFPWASSITPDSSKIQDPKITVLASSSSRSWLKTEGIAINPEMLKNSLDNLPPDSEMKPAVLACDIEGKFTSYFAGRKLPAGTKNYVPKSEHPGRIVVVSTPFAFTNNIQPVSLAQNMNINFFLSTLDVMHGLDELVKSRNRIQTENPMIGPVDMWMKNLMVIFNFMLPLIFISGYAVLRFMTRNRLSKKVYSAMSGAGVKEGESNA
ncbi:MAG: GldG family protein [Spirochaetia bacterium]|nr:GldG family protein [Spirochaetia bacterium]